MYPPLPLLLCLLVSGTLSAQSVHVIGLEVGRAEYAPLIDVGTRIDVWVNTDESFIILADSVDVTLKVPETGTDLILASDSVKLAYDAETERLRREEGRFRMSSKMEYAFTVDKGRPAEDTTGFTFRIQALAPPPTGTSRLHLGGVLSYSVATTDTVGFTVPMSDLYATAEEGSAFRVDGVTFAPVRTGVVSFTGVGYRLRIPGYEAVKFSIDGAPFTDTFYVEDEVARAPMELQLRAVRTEVRELPLDLEFGIGMD